MLFLYLTLGYTFLGFLWAKCLHNPGDDPAIFVLNFLAWPFFLCMVVWYVINEFIRERNDPRHF